MAARFKKTGNPSEFYDFRNVNGFNRFLFESGENEDAETQNKANPNRGETSDTANERGDASDSTKTKSEKDAVDDENQAIPKTPKRKRSKEEYDEYLGNWDETAIGGKKGDSEDTNGAQGENGHIDADRYGERARDDRLTYSYKVIGNDGKTNFSVPKYLVNDRKTENDSDGIVSGLLKKYGKKRMQKFLTKAGYKTLSKKAAKSTGKGIAKKIAAKGLAKTGAKLGAKSLSKKLPFGLGLVPALWYAGERALEGDYSGAGLELASGATAAVPYLGTLGSVGIDSYLLDRDMKKSTGSGIAGHAAKGAAKLAANYIKKKLKGESSIKVETLYDRAKFVFESAFGIDESVGGYRFDDYVMECNADNRNFGSSDVNESGVYFGYRTLLESTSLEDELDELFKVLSADGKVSMEDLKDKPGDTSDISNAKKRIREILSGGKSGGGRNPNIPYYALNKKDYKRALDSETDSSGNLTTGQKLHKGFDQLGDAVSKNLSRYGIPQSLSRKLHIPRNLFRLAGTALGGMMFGPLGALGGAALSNWIANSHQNYKAKQYARAHGLDDKSAKGERSGYLGKAIGAGLGSALGPAGSAIGMGIGHLLDRKVGPMINGGGGKN